MSEPGDTATVGVLSPAFASEEAELGIGPAASRGRGGGKRKKEVVAAFDDELSDDELSVTGSMRGSTSMTRMQARQIVKQLYPKVERKPTLQQLVNTILSQEGDELSFVRGDWVEYLGDDMVWHVDQVRGIVRQAPDDWDWSDPSNEGKEPEYEKLYQVGGDILRNAETVRATEQGLQRIFGMRPWVFQQWAILGLERKVRFQKDHEDDFEEVDCQEFVVELWQSWLTDPENSQFRELFESHTEAQQEALEACIFTPFELLDNITESEDWHFEDDEISIYTYTAAIGSGTPLCIVALFLQMFIPVILVENAIEESNRFLFGPETSYRFDVIDDEICSGDGNFGGKTLIFCVVLLYILTVVPEVMLRFYRMVGDAATSSSRLNSLREMVWRQQDDTMAQKIGFKLDRYMNAGYPALLYISMIFILFNTETVLDILLNALAIEFVMQIDEQIAASGWYDPDNRWISAGAWGLAAQATIRLRVIESPQAFCARYNIDPLVYVSSLRPELADKSDGKKMRAFASLSLHNPKLAEKDDRTPVFFHKIEDAIKVECANYARKHRNEEALRAFSKPLVNFSMWDRFVTTIIPNTESTGMFDHFKGFRTWSMWEAVLFLSPVPEKIEDVEAEVNDDKVRRFVARESSTFEKFFWDCFDVLTLKRYIFDVSRAIGKNRSGLHKIPLVLFFLLDGIMQWLFYALILVFPFVILASTFIVPYCY